MRSADDYIIAGVLSQVAAAAHLLWPGSSVTRLDQPYGMGYHEVSAAVDVPHPVFGQLRLAHAFPRELLQDAGFLRHIIETLVHSMGRELAHRAIQHADRNLGRFHDPRN